jgi:hypothetical protein
MITDNDFIAIARYIDQREALLVDRVETQIREVANHQKQTDRKVADVAQQVRAKPRQQARRDR